MIEQDAARYVEKLGVLIDAENNQERMMRLMELLKELKICLGIIKESHPAQRSRHRDGFLPKIILKIQKELGETK